MNGRDRPTCWIIAGPNGAGKTTFALKYLPEAGMAKLRVAERVSHGGHDIPVPDIERRFFRSWENLIDVYASLVDRTVCSLNSGDTPEIVFMQRGEHREVIQPEMMRVLQSWRRS